MIISEIYYKVAARRLMDSIRKSARTNSEKGYDFKQIGKSGGRTKRWPIAVTIDELIQKLKENDMRCEKTGIPFPLILNEKHYTKAWARKLGFNPLFVPSCDRIDPTMGYILSNIQIVVQVYNLGKGTKTQAEMDDYMKYFQLVNIPKKHTIYEHIKTTTKTILKPKQMNKELLNYLIQQNDFENAEKYFEHCNNKQTKNTKNVNTKQRNTGKLSHQERRSWFKKNSKLVKQCSENMVSISAIFKNKKGYNDSAKIFESKHAQTIIDNNIKTFKMTKGRGYEYFINQEDKMNIGL
jgi:hypothetical protein